jgi:hypothetical protein
MCTCVLGGLTSQCVPTRCLTSQCVRTGCLTSQFVRTGCLTSQCVRTGCLTSQFVRTGCLTSQCVRTGCLTAQCVRTGCLTSQFVSKTQIALQYAYRRSRDPACSVFWVHADNETTFTQDYKVIAKRLGLAGSLDGPELLTAVRERIEVDPCWVHSRQRGQPRRVWSREDTARRRGEARHSC